ncbi:MAG: tetratricopeptide repeat protein, partial [Gammaproteobacteria bacterium]
MTDANTINEPLEEHHSARPSILELEKLVTQSRFGEAQDLCGQLLKANPKDHTALFWGGVIAIEYQRFADAAQAFERAIKIDPSIPEYHANLGRALIGLKKIEEAKSAADMAEALEPEDART